MTPETQQQLTQRLGDLAQKELSLSSLEDAALRAAIQQALDADEAQPCQNVRLNFSAPSEEKITAGVALMGEVLQEVLK